MTPEERREWDTSISSYRRQLREIVIPPDIEPALAKYILSKLDSLYGELRVMYGDILRQYKTTDGLIERIKNKSSTGGNIESRKKNGIEAVENVELGDGSRVNMYDVMNDIIYKKEDLESLLDIIEKKNSMIITMNGLLKVESNIAGH